MSPMVSTWAASSSRLCSSSRWKAVWKSARVRAPQKIRVDSRSVCSLKDGGAFLFGEVVEDEGL